MNKKRLIQPVILGSKVRTIGFNRNPVQEPEKINIITGLTYPDIDRDVWGSYAKKKR